MSLTVLRLSAQEHDEFVREHPNGHLMQMTAWGREKEHTGWTWRTVAVGRPAQDGAPQEVTGAALILFRRTPLLPMALAYVPRGFVLDWADKETLEALVAEASRVAKAHRGVLLRLDPAVPVGDPHARAALEALGFTRTDPGDDPAKTSPSRPPDDHRHLRPRRPPARLAKGTRWSIRRPSAPGSSMRRSAGTRSTSSTTCSRPPPSGASRPAASSTSPLSWTSSDRPTTSSSRSSGSTPRSPSPRRRRSATT